MQQFSHRVLCLIFFASIHMMQAKMAHAQQATAEEHPAISAEAQKLGGKFIPLSKPSSPMKITRGEKTTPFIPLPEQHNDGRMIQLNRGEKFYTLPARPDSPVITRPRPDTLNSDVTNVAVENIRKQQILYAAGKLPTSLQGGAAMAAPDAHGVKVTHGIEPNTASREQGIAAPSKTVQTAPYGSKLQSSSAPKGASMIAPDLREGAAIRARDAGSAADPLDVLMQGAPTKPGK